MNIKATRMRSIEVCSAEIIVNFEKKITKLIYFLLNTLNMLLFAIAPLNVSPPAL